MPKVSVIIPTFNRKAWLQLAIDSVCAQTYRDFELIIIDDGSTDGTEETIRSKYGDKVRYIYQENQGESSARNHGAEVARGEYLAFLDSDDLWLSTKLAQQVAYLDSHYGSDAVFCLAWSINEEGRLNPRFPYGSQFKSTGFSLQQILKDRYSLGGASTILMRKTAFERLQGFDESITYGEDLDFCVRLFLHGCEPAIIERPLAAVRTHGTSQSLTLNATKVDRVMMDHLIIYDKVLASVKDETILTYANLARLKEYFRAYGYYLFTADREKAEAIKGKIETEYKSGLSNEALYDYIIDYYIPLVFLSHYDMKETIAFVYSVLEEKKKHTQDSVLNNRLALIRTYVWCALRGKPADFVVAARFLWSSMWKAPGLLREKQYYVWLMKLLFGRLAKPIFRLRIWLAFRNPAIS